MLHEHTKGQSGDLCQPGGERSVQLDGNAVNISEMLPISLPSCFPLGFLLWSIIDEFSSSLSGEVSPFIN